MKRGWHIYLGGLLLLTAADGCASRNPHVLIQTELGDMEVKIYETKAPITAANFLRYVDEERFNDGSFYRVVRMDNQPDNDIRIEVIQGGTRARGRENTLPPIDHETTETTGILHTDGVISMARGRPGSASSEFFICVGDQPELDYGGMRNPDGQGFAAFGKIIKGMDVAREIQQQPDERQQLKEPVKILSIRRIR